jgi:hypothetical protein
MKIIEPVQIWHNGQAKEASVLDARIIYDDLKSNCTFYYELKESDIITQHIEGGINEGMRETTQMGNKLADGNISLSGEDYLDWDGGNDYAFDFIANYLNLVIVVDPIEEIPEEE